MTIWRASLHGHRRSFNVLINVFKPSRCSSTSTAPRVFIDVKSIRQNPDLYSQTCLERNYKKQASHPQQILELFNSGVALQRSARASRERRNAIESSVGQLDASEAKDSLLAEARELKNELLRIEKDEKAVNEKIEALAIELPNLTHDETPRGNDPKTVEVFNVDLKDRIASPNPAARNHVDLGSRFDLLDFTSAAKTSGWGWYFLKNEAGILGQALTQYAIHVAMKHNFNYVEPPSMVYSGITTACGFRPRDQSGEQQIYSIQQSETDLARVAPSHSLSGTAEIPFAGMNADTTLPATQLPLRIVGPSRCFRAEAGARGLRTKGLYRVHEFTKVEMFAWTFPTRSQEVFTTMLSIQTEILQNLGLCYRILEMPSADLGASAHRKQDIEVYFPSRAALADSGGWGEVTSTSMCTDYQTRRLGTRVKAADGSLTFPHTVNGTAVAVPRVLAALLEYGYDAESDSIAVPEVLWPWMHGITRIERRGA